MRFAATLLGLALVAAPGGAELALAPDGDGLRLIDGGEVGRLAILAWDTSWAHSGTLAGREGTLADRLTATMALPGRAAGQATIEATAERRDGVYKITLSARFSEATALNAFSLQLDVPLARLAGPVRGLPDGGTVSTEGEAFGGNVTGIAAVPLTGGRVLLFGAPGRPLLVQDNRRFGAQTCSLRQTLISGEIRAGARVCRSYVLATCAAGEEEPIVAKLLPPSSYDPAGPAVLVEADGELSLLGPGGVARATIRLGVHGREWALTEQPAADIHGGDLAADVRTVTGAIPVPGADGGAVEYEEVVQPQGDGFALTYTIRRAEPLAINSHHLSLSVPLPPHAGQIVTMVGEETREVTLPAEHGELHLARLRARELRFWPGRDDGMTITVDPPTPVLLQDNRRFGSDQLEVRFEFGGDMERPLPPGETTLRLVVRPKGPVQVLLDADAVHQVTDTTGWFPYPLPWDECPVDLSFLNHKPAGSHGFLRCRDGRFEFEDGTPARFWGTCFSASANFPTHEQAERIARRLAKFGVNIVRTHHADANWSQPNFFAFGDRTTGSTTEFEPESLDRFDYLLACLKREGIYIYLDQLVHRKFTAADGVDAPDQLDNAAKPYSNFDEKLIAAQQAFSRKLLSHVNPYTGVAYRDEPAVVLMEFANENDLMTQQVSLEPYRSRLEQRFRTWAAERGIEVPAGEVKFDNGRDPYLPFLVDVQREYYEQMTAFMRELGVRIPLTGSNWSRNAALLAALEPLDYTDSHAYHHHPFGGRVANRPFIGQTGNMMQWLSFNRLAGKPFFVSEWDTPWPNEHRAELILWIAGVAALQDWGGLTVYTYRHSAATPIDWLSGAFETFNDPCRFGLFPAAALIYRRGDVAPAREKVTVSIPRDRAVHAPSPSPYGTAALTLTPEVHRTEVTLGEPGPDAGRVVGPDERVISPDEVVRSDTGELTRRLGEQGYGTIDTPRSQAAYGFLGAAGELTLSDVTLRVQTPFAVVAVSSLTDKPIAATNRLLVTAVARSENTAMRWNARRNGLVSNGTGPILVEPVVGELSLRLRRSGWRVVPLAADGGRGEPVATTAGNGALRLPLGAARTIYYLLETDE